MRLSSIASILTFTLASTVLAAPPPVVAGRADAPEVAGSSNKDGGSSPIDDMGRKVTAGGAETGTKFNGQQVPAILEIEGAKIDETISKGYW